jgi:hypothetical protein
MNHLFSRVTSRQGLASCVLALMVYQLGACPCGCLEHNAWLQWAGITSDDRGTPEDRATPDELGEVAAAASAVESQVTTADGDYHDCNGEPRPQYVDNARSARLADDFLERLATVVVILNASVDDTTVTAGRFNRDPGSVPLAHALSRPALQVYRL